MRNRDSEETRLGNYLEIVISKSQLLRDPFSAAGLGLGILIFESSFPKDLEF